MLNEISSLPPEATLASFVSSHLPNFSLIGMESNVPLELNVTDSISIPFELNLTELFPPNSNPTELFPPNPNATDPLPFDSNSTQLLPITNPVPWEGNLSSPLGINGSLLGINGSLLGLNGSLSNSTVVEDEGEFPLNMMIFTAIMAFVIAILGCAGNLLTVVALPMSRSLRTTASVFVVNLALVELLFCLLILPLMGAQMIYYTIHHESLLSDHACIYFTVVRFTLTQVELQSILAIALMRAVAVSCMHLYKRINNPTLVGIYVACIWIYSFAIHMPTALGMFGHYRYNHALMKCDMGEDPASVFARKILLTAEATFPVLFIIFLYVFIFTMIVRRSVARDRKLSGAYRFDERDMVQLEYVVKLSSMRVARSTVRRKEKDDKETKERKKKEEQERKKQEQEKKILERQVSDNAQGDTPTGQEKFKLFRRMVSNSSIKSTFTRKASTMSQKMATSRRDMRVARTIFIIFLVMLVCNVPVGVVHSGKKYLKHKSLLLGTYILYWIQYCSNVIIYVLMNKQYRDAYVDVLSRQFPSIKRYKGGRFFWQSENSTVTKPPSNPKTTLSRKPSEGESSDGVRDMPERTSAHYGYPRPGRLSAIQETISVTSEEGNKVALPLLQRKESANQTPTPVLERTYE